MSWYPPSDSPVSGGTNFDGVTCSNGETAPLGLLPIPATFIGYVEVELSARVVQAAPADESPWMMTIRTFITKGAAESSCVVLGTPSVQVSGKSYVQGSNYLLGATLLPSADDPNVMEVRVHGRVGTVVYFDGSGSLHGRVQSGDG